MLVQVAELKTNPSVNEKMGNTSLPQADRHGLSSIIRIHIRINIQAVIMLIVSRRNLVPKVLHFPSIILPVILAPTPYETPITIHIQNSLRKTDRQPPFSFARRDSYSFHALVPYENSKGAVCFTSASSFNFSYVLVDMFVIVARRPRGYTNFSNRHTSARSHRTGITHEIANHNHHIKARRGENGTDDLRHGKYLSRDGDRVERSGIFGEKEVREKN